MVAEDGIRYTWEVGTFNYYSLVSLYMCSFLLQI